MSIPRLASAAAVLSFLAVGALASCGGDDTVDPVVHADAGKADVTIAPAEAGDGVDTGADAAMSADEGAADAGAVVRGPVAIPFDGDPSGLYWEYGANAALYIADTANNRIVKWTDKEGFVARWDLPPPPDPGGAGLGQVVRALDGTMFVTRFGFGTAGAVVSIDKTGDGGPLSGPDASLSVKRRRIGLALLPDGTLVDTYFTPGDAGRIGAVASLKLTPSEKNLVTGLTKPVGVLFNEGKLFITDQDLGLLFSVAITGGVYTPEAGAPDADDGSAAADADDGSAAADADDGSAAADADASPGDASDGAAVDAGRASVFARIAGADLLCQGPDGTLFVGSSSGTVFQVARDGTVTMPFSGTKQTRGCAYDGAHRRLFVAEHDPADAGGVNTIRIYPIP